MAWLWAGYLVALSGTTSQTVVGGQVGSVCECRGWPRPFQRRWERRPAGM